MEFSQDGTKFVQRVLQATLDRSDRHVHLEGDLFTAGPFEIREFLIFCNDYCNYHDFSL